MNKKITSEHQVEYKKKWQEKLIKRGLDNKNSGNKLRPRCIYEQQQITLSSEGYFTPCCWLDDELYRNQPYVNNFYKEHLNIENNENVQNIFDSKEWKEFWDILLNKPENAPPVCYEYCASNKGEKKILKNKNINYIEKH